MKIVGISDLHGNLPEIPKCDVVCICGDIFPTFIDHNIYLSSMWLFDKFYPWVNSLDCSKVILIAGNHDFLFEHVSKNCDKYYNNHEYVMTKLGMNDYSDKLEYLQDSLFEFEGVKFYGTPWCQNLKNWAFYKSNDELEIIFDKIPKDIDVLLTHQPPTLNKCGIVLQRKNWNYMKELGCLELSKAILDKKPKLVMSGHIHTGNHIKDNEHDIQVVNVSVLDENYKMSYMPFEYELKNEISNGN